EVSGSRCSAALPPAAGRAARLVPYTTLFLSHLPRVARQPFFRYHPPVHLRPPAEIPQVGGGVQPDTQPRLRKSRRHQGADRSLRSEEHASELQSRENLVCRLRPGKKQASQTP